MKRPWQVSGSRLATGRPRPDGTKAFFISRASLLLALLLISIPELIASAQGLQIGIKWTGLAVHPKRQPSAGAYGRKVDRRGYLVRNSGVTVVVDVKCYRQWGLKLAQVLLWRDCAGKFASLSHVGLNLGGAGATLGNGRHGLSGSIGPMLYRRRSWKHVVGYVPDKSWRKAPANSNWETKWIPVGGQLEYNYYFGTHYGLGVNVLPGYPDVIGIAAGLSARK